MRDENDGDALNKRSRDALEGLRVLELSDEKTSWCGKLLADLGADVVLVEPPKGDPARLHPPFASGRRGPDRSLAFLYSAANKRSLALDLDDAGDRTRFRQLLGDTDLVVEGFAPGYLAERDLDLQALHASRPELVLASITAFGQTGPHRHYRGGDLVANAMGGAMFVTGEPDDPPIRLAGSQALCSAGAAAAASSLVALHGAARTGRGQHVDISLQEVVASVSHISGVGKWLDDGIVPVRNGSSLFASVPSGSYRCRDGLVYLMVNRPLHWQALAQWIAERTDHEAVLDPLFEGASSNRIEYRDLLDIFIGDLAIQFDVDVFYREAQERHLAVTPVHGAAGVAEDTHLAAREFFVDVDHPVAGSLRQPGAPYRHEKTPWRMRRPAPQLDEHRREILSAIDDAPTEPARAAEFPSQPQEPPPPALEGLRVLEFTAAMAGPWIGRILAHCGADSVRIESRKRPDVVRLYTPPWDRDLGIQPQLSPWFTDWNAGKRFIGLDLTQPRAVEIARQLAAQADVVVDNYSTGVLEKLGLGYDVLRQENASLVMISTTGFGHEGPRCRYVTWGSNVEAVSGLARLSGPTDRDCTITQYAYPDALSAIHCVSAVMAALRHRDRTGEGQHIGVSQYELTATTIGPLLMDFFDRGDEPTKTGNASPDRAPQGCYPCQGEDRWCVIEAADDDAWKLLCGVLGRPEWDTDPRFEDAPSRKTHAAFLDAEISAWTRERDAYEVMDSLQAVGIASGVVQTVEDEFERDAHLRERGFFETIPHVAKGNVIAAGLPVGLTDPPGSSRSAGEAVGQDNEAVLGEWLGMTADEVAADVAAGAVERAD